MIIICLFIYSCDVDKFDNKLKIRNNLDYSIVAYLNGKWPDTTIGGPLKTIDAHEECSVPFPGNWDEYISACDTATFHFVDFKYYDSSKAIKQENVIKRILATKQYLDSIDWVIVVP
jgi:hypothetical protein